jgi:copper chaperone CopZ
MNAKSHTHTNTAFIAHRTLSVPGMTCENCERTITNTLGALDGVLEITTNLRRKKVKITYDASIVGFDTLAQAFIHSGYPLENNLWSRLRYILFRFSDGNAFDNSRTPASPCCSNPKSIYAKRHK